jgi:hypothetical protein
MRRALPCALPLRPRSGLDQKDHTEGYSAKLQYMRLKKSNMRDSLNHVDETIANKFGGIQISLSNWTSNWYRKDCNDRYGLSGYCRLVLKLTSMKPTGFSAIALELISRLNPAPKQKK